MEEIWGELRSFFNTHEQAIRLGTNFTVWLRESLSLCAADAAEHGLLICTECLQNKIQKTSSLDWTGRP